jgi:uncharacterized protein YbjT (DUF2867 family)
MPIVVVADATGHIRWVVDYELLANGHNVRAIARSADKAKTLAKLGAELLIDVGFLTRSLRVADGVSSFAA